MASFRELDITGITSAARVRSVSVDSAVDESGLFGYVEGRNVTGTKAAFAVIRSSDAPSSYDFSVSGEAGLTLEQASDGTIAVKDSSGNLVNFIQRPWAVDAAGQNLPTSYRVEGTTITQTVDLADAVFPVVADPSYGCGVGWCSVYFNRSETHDWATGGIAALGGAAAACGIGGPVAIAACGVAAGAIGAMAIIADNHGDCIGFLVQPLGYNPFIHGDVHCR